MKVKRRASRNAASLLGTVLAAAGISAGSASAMAQASGCASGSAGSASACASAGAGHLSARAEALALLGHRGSQSTVTGKGAAGVPGMPPRVPAVVTLGTRSALNGVFCVSASNCLAVGSFDSATSGASLNQVLHWNGRKWSKVTVPSRGGTTAGDFSELDAVRCRTASDGWAVGDYLKGGALLNQALHWNGTRWAAVRTPNPGGILNGDNHQLFDIVCTGARACWAAGEYGSSAGSGLTLNQALRWNGKKWSTLTIPSPGGTGNGDFSILSSLACTSATNCWAAGSFGAFTPVRTSLNQILHWNGRTWSQDTAVPNPDGSGQGAVNELNAVTCSSASSCWSVGDFGSIQNGVGMILNQALRWNGKAWSATFPPNPGGTADGSFNALNAIRCTAATNCWAVGRAGNTDFNQALHWHGTRWSAA